MKNQLHIAKTILKNMLAAFVLLLVVGQASAQTPLVYGCSPFQDSMWAVDTTTMTIVSRLAPTLSGFTITGINGMAYDPCDHQTYVIMKVSGVSGRVLGTMDVTTGVCTQVGNLGDNFSSITFREDGQLFGLTGNGATVPETIYLIDKANGNKTVAATLGNGADGEVFVYDWDSDVFYHWSGNGTVIFESVGSQSPYTVTPITYNGGAGEIFGAIYLGNGYMWVATINSDLRRALPNGFHSPSGFFSTPDDLRGLVMPPNFGISDDTICAGVDSVTIGFGGLTTDTVRYAWGDGNVTSVYPAGNASHSYATQGNMTVHVILSNACNAADTLTSFTVRVENIPVVAITPGDTTICDTNAVTLVATSGGASQWYMNGVAIPGADSASIVVTANGVYNMVKTNLNGCADSASVGTRVTFGTTPVVDLGADTTLCNGAQACFGVAHVQGQTYLWNTGATTDSVCVSAGGNLFVDVTSAEGCKISDTVVVAALATPSPSIVANTSLCPLIGFHGQEPAATSWMWDFGDGNTSTATTPAHTYTANGTYLVAATGINDCGNGSDTFSITISCIVAIENSIDGTVAVYPNPVRDQVYLRMVLDQPMTVSYEVVDLVGRTVLAVSPSDARQQFEATIPMNVPAGTYILRVNAGEGTASYRLVKDDR